MIFKNPYFDNVEKIELLEKWILINSYLYYIKGNSIVEDIEYNENAKQLEEFIRLYSEDFKQSKYYYCFKDFSISTGFDLWYKLEKETQDIIIDLVDLMLEG